MTKVHAFEGFSATRKELEHVSVTRTFLSRRQLYLDTPLLEGE